MSFFAFCFLDVRSLVRRYFDEISDTVNLDEIPVIPKEYRPEETSKEERGTPQMDDYEDDMESETEQVNFKIFGLSLATINFILSIALTLITIKYLYNEKDR